MTLPNTIPRPMKIALRIAVWRQPPRLSLPQPGRSSTPMQSVTSRSSGRKSFAVTGGLVGMTVSSTGALATAGGPSNPDVLTSTRLIDSTAIMTRTKVLTDHCTAVRFTP